MIGLIAFLACIQVFAQSAGNDTTQYVYYRFTYGNALDRYWAKHVLLIPVDTIYSKDGVALKNGIMYIGDGTKWTPVGSSGSADSSIFATVTRLADSSAALRGLISPFTTTTPGIVTPAGAFNSRAFLRTDNTFQTAVIPSDTAAKWIGWGYRSHDSIYLCKGNPAGTFTCAFAWKDSVGGGPSADTSIQAGTWLKEEVTGLTKKINVDTIDVPSIIGHRSELQQIGTFITPKMFVGGHNPGGSPVFSFTVDTMVISGTFNNILNYVLASGIYQFSQLENYSIESYAKIDSTPTATTYGIGLGKQCSSTMVGWLDCSTGPSAGKLFLSFRAAGILLDSVVAVSSSSLSVVQGHIIKMSFQKQYDTITITATDTTSPNTVSLKWVYPPDSTYNQNFKYLPTTAGSYAVYIRGGKYDVSGFTVSSMLPQNAPLATFGDSKAQGVGGSHSHDSTYIWLLDSLYTPALNLGSSGDLTQDLIQRVQEVLNIHPQQVILEVGSNDLRTGVSLSTLKINYKIITDTLTHSGIRVYHLCLPEKPVSGSTDMTAFNFWLKSTYPTTYIPNIYDDMNACSNCNTGIHPNGVGHALIYQDIVASRLLTKNMYRAQADFVDASHVGASMSNASKMLAVDNGAIKTVTGDLVGLIQKGGNPATSTLQIGTTTAFDVDILRNGKKIVTVTDAFPTQLKFWSKSGTNTGTVGVDSLNNTYLGSTMPTGATGSSNLFVGGVAGNSNISGGFNTQVGFFAGRFNASGSNNVNVGEACGYYNLGSTNTMLGTQCNFGSTSANIGGSVFIGFQSGYYETNSNRFQISNSNAQNLLYGDFATGRLRVNPGTNGTSPLTLDASAQFEVSSTTRGMLIPRMTTAQMNAISSPTIGLHVWNSDSLSDCIYTGSAWRISGYNIAGGSSGITRIAPLDSLTKDTKGVQISGISLVPQTADATHAGLVSTAAQTIAGVKTFASSPVVPTPSGGTDAVNKNYVDGLIPTGGLAAGTYSPTLSSYVNCSAVSNTTFQYMKIGKQVWVSGYATVQLTANSGNFSFFVSLPTSTTAAPGGGSGTQEAASGTYYPALCGGTISGGAGVEAIHCNVNGTSGDNVNVSFHFMYITD